MSKFLKKQTKPKLIVLGLDGVPYRLIKDLSGNDVMPNLGFLVKQGTLCKMESSIPEVSSVAWASIITGKNPGEHGIYGFMDLRPETYKFFFPNFNCLQAKPFWGIWDTMKSAIVNVPGTYPARSLHGILIAGFVALDLKKATYPSTLVPRLEEMDYRIDVDSSKGHKSIELFLKDLDQTLDARIRTLFNLYDMEDWDIFMFVFTGTDRLSHFLWDAYEDESHAYHDKFLEYFSQIDKAIGNFIEKVGDVPCIVLSDHGFERLDCDVNVNFLLQKEGFLHFEKEKPDSLEDVSSKTSAFSLEPARIYIHCDKRYPQGSVRGKEKEKIIQDLLAFFDSLKIDGRKVIKKGFRKEEIYSGPYRELAPDIVCIPEKGFNLRSNIKAESLYSKSVFTGKHSQEDAFFLLANVQGVQVPHDMGVTKVVGMVESIVEGD
jgi:predicted AlkP superfamily phosphohydrolase/phosphomutase